MSRTTRSTDNIIFGRGTIWLARAEPVGPERSLGDIASASISIAQTRVAVQAGSGAPRTLANVVTESTVTISMSLIDISMDNLGLFFGSDPVDTLAKTVDDEAIAIGDDISEGPWYALRTASGSAVDGVELHPQKNKGGTKVAKTKYTLDARNGRIRILPTSSDLKGTTIYASYTRTAAKRLSVQGIQQHDWSLRYLESNPLLVKSGRTRTFYAPRVSIEPGGDFNLRDNTPQTLQLVATLMNPADGRSALTVDGQDL